MKYFYEIGFVDGKTLTFETETNIDFHDMKPTAVCFNDLFINLANVTFFRKFEECCGNCIFHDAKDKECEHPDNEYRMKTPDDEPACGGWRIRKNENR